MEGSFGFGFWNGATLTAPDLDPTYGSFQLSVKMFDFITGNFVTVKELELANINNETHPEYFYGGSALSGFRETSGFYTGKDYSEIVL